MCGMSTLGTRSWRWRVEVRNTARGRRTSSVCLPPGFGTVPVEYRPPMFESASSRLASTPIPTSASYVAGPSWTRTPSGNHEPDDLVRGAEPEHRRVRPRREAGALLVPGHRGLDRFTRRNVLKRGRWDGGTLGPFFAGRGQR